ncbi:MAG: hypothetical protein IKV16_02805 [Clostridia bacterium]|nr:hypothetical protein [Clostridia bacterium]
MSLTKNIKFGGMNTGHIQGIATDKDRKYMYYSFTTSFVKTDMQGNIIGSVEGLCGHLGCIAYNYDDGRVYGSLEFKHDAIGKPILERVSRQRNATVDVEDGFYIAYFDVDKIDRIGMDAEKDGIMKAVFLSEVTDDFNAEGHRHGCSGIDGLTFAPIPGQQGKNYLYVAYGIYEDLEREDNDCQVILRYDFREFDKCALPLNQNTMHRSGPQKYEGKYFVYTGNTRWGVQNLEYDRENDIMLLAVYVGHKPTFPNYPMFVVDMKKSPVSKDGRDYLTLSDIGVRDAATGICGIDFPYGSTGVISLGEGKYYFSKPSERGEEWSTEISLYSFDGKGNFTEL